MFTRSYLVMPILLSLAILLSACGGDEVVDGGAAAVQATSIPASTEEAVAPEPIAAPTPSVVQTVPVAPSGVGVNGGTPVAIQASLGLGGDDLSTMEVVKILTPSVVQIVTETPTMGFFLQAVPSQGVGTGVILDREGHILTNNHVISGAQRIDVTLSDGRTFSAQLVGGDISTDTAVIRIEADRLQPAKLGSSSELQVGEDVIAIGHALGLPGGPTVTKGVVSALGRSIDTTERVTIVDLIQTDAAINPGNSGGALANARAEVIGINTAIIQGGRGIGFAINIDDVKVVVAQLIEKGIVERGFLGISPVNMTPGLADRLGLTQTPGIFVARVIGGTAADNAGLMEGDILVELGDEAIRNTGELSKFLIAHPPGDTINVVYFRGDREIKTTVTLGQRPSG